MPTFNQLVRKGRQTSEKKSTAPALQKGLQIMVHYLIFAHKNRISPVHAKLVYYVFSRKSRDFLRFSATILSFLSEEPAPYRKCE